MLVTTTTSSGDGGAAAMEAAAEAQESGELGGGTAALTGGFSEEDKTTGGNRWPRQETLALLQIRSDMDLVFRDSSLKGPLWEQVSRKMSELGYHRNAKKCKEKFENVYKYHKRTKDGRTSKADGKSYRFFDQLNALENITTSSAPLPAPPQQRPPQPPPPATSTMATMTTTPTTPMQALNANVTVSSTSTIAVSVAQSTPPQNFSNFINSSFPTPQPLFPPPATPTPANVTNPTQTNTVPAPAAASQMNISTSFLSNSPFSSSSSTSSDDDIERRHKRKRKLKDFFEKVMKDVVEKQEELQKNFLETLEKRESDRMIREEAWRVQEMARIKREHDLLVQERSMAAARESALIGYLQKMTDQQIPQAPQQPTAKNATQVQIPVQLPSNPSPPPPPPQQAAIPSPAPPQPPPPPMTTTTPVLSPEPIRAIDNTPRTANGGDTFMGTTPSSRWPKAEVEALINLRTSLDNKYQENGPKGPLWEEISNGMKRLGYNRSSKRCKEKWENINKYFKKVKESNKKRPEDAKTCPYFHQLDALYKERATGGVIYTNTTTTKPEDAMVPIMARPENQWPLPQVIHHNHHLQHQQQHQVEEHEGDNIDDDEDNDGDDDDEEDDDDEGMGYEIVTNKTSSVATTAE